EDVMLSRHRKWSSLAWASAALLALVAAVGCFQVGQQAGVAADTGKKAEPDPNVVELTFTYGSEKKSWIDDVTREFNAAGKKLPDGRTIRVNAIPLGSGECVEEILAGRRQTHLTSPASGAYVEIGNGRSQKKMERDLLGKPKFLVRSPVV